MRYVPGAAVIVVQARKEEEIVRNVGWRLAYHPDPGGELGLFPPVPVVELTDEFPALAEQGVAYQVEPTLELGFFPPAPTVQENHELPVQANEGRSRFLDPSDLGILVVPPPLPVAQGWDDESGLPKLLSDREPRVKHPPRMRRSREEQPVAVAGAPFLRMACSWQARQDLQGVSGGSFSILGWSRFTTVQAVQHQLHPAGDPEFIKHSKQVIFHRVLS